MNVKGGDTNVTTYFALRQSSGASAGQAATALTITDFDLQYVRSGAAPSAKVDATALAATDSAHGDNQAIEIDATDQPGLYRVDWPDAAFAAGVREVILTVKVATAFTEHLRVQIDPPVNVVAISDDQTAADNLESACDNYSAERGLSGTALPAAAADAAGGLPISDAGGLDLDAMNTNINDIETDTADMQPRVVAIEVDTSTTLQAELDGIQADTEDIQSRLPAALVGGKMDSDMTAISGDTGAADKLEEGATALVTLTVNDASATTTSFVTSSTEATDDHYNGRIISFTTGNLAGQATDITDYNGTTKAVTVTALTEAPGNGDAFLIS